jgi:NDP-sugar pyrophosphorylase family protein
MNQTNNLTLVIMAAGMGSRYGGLKQIDPIGKHGEFIIDYSIYDAIKAGFNKVVFIIKEENYEVFRDTVGKRVEKLVDVKYAFQKNDAVPEGTIIPEGRTKPWGTAHAVYSCKELVNENFAVINADDFYGRDSFVQLADFLKEKVETGEKYHFAMAGFILNNTLTENGHVARGVCTTDENNYLKNVTERTKIQYNDGKVQFFEEGDGWTTIDPNSTVSMNCWGFTPDIFVEIRKQMTDFFKKDLSILAKAEFFLPSVVQNLIDNGTCDVKVLNTTAKWYGVTYHEDKEEIVSFISKQIENGVYPDNLWNQ